MCTPATGSCAMESCALSDNSMYLFAVCMDDSLISNALVAVSDHEGTAATSASCPTGMWAVYAYNHHHSTGFTCGDGCCMRDVSGRKCDDSTYTLGATSITNPAATCSGSSCNDDGTDFNSLGLLCLCLPGHAVDAGGGCAPCSLGTRPSIDMASCEPCAAGHYCARQDGDETECGAGNYCPESSSSPTPITPGYYGTGGGSTTRTGQAPCEVSVTRVCVFRSRLGIPADSR